MTYPIRLSLLAASVLALSAASAVSLFASGNFQSTRNYCVEHCERKYFICVDYGYPGSLCDIRFEECTAECPPAP